MKKWMMATTIVLLLLLPVFYMAIDSFFTGDEVVTYSMANNAEGGFVFSQGRISDYLSSEVFNKDGRSLASKLFDVGSDVLKNKGNAKILNFPRDPEVRLYTGDEINDWFQKRDYERFNIGTTWLHSLSDDGNSWLYYSLVNLSSSLFMGISATKWSAFLVNIIFHALTLLVLLKIGRELGNDSRQNIGMLVFYGASFEVLTRTVTNLRPYTVGSFFATLLVLMIMSLYEKVISDENSFGKSIPVIILIYGIGYVSHYTVGAVFASFGIALLVFMLVGKHKDVGKILLTGIVGILFGIFLSPDSIIGVLKKFVANGGGSDKELEPFVILVLAIALVVFVAILVSVIRNKDYANNVLLFITCAVSLMFIVIVGGTKGFGYARVLFPVTYAVIFRWLIILGDRISTENRKELMKKVSVALIGVYALVNLIFAYQYKMDENSAFLAKQEALDEIEIKTCYFFRKHAQGYMDTRNLLGRSENVQVITIDTEGWEDMVELLPSSVDEPVLLYFADESEDEAALLWIQSFDYTENKDVYKDESTHIIVASKSANQS